MGLRDLFLARCAMEAVRRKSVPKVRCVGDLGIACAVIVDRAEDGDAPVPGAGGEQRQIGKDCFGAFDIEPAVRHDEIVLGIHIPEDRTSHSTHPAPLPGLLGGPFPQAAPVIEHGKGILPRPVGTDGGHCFEH